MFKLNKNIKMNRGMSYVELIVVLSIFALLSSVAVYNYGNFQTNVDIKNLASDIASKIVEAQKSSLNGALPTKSGYDSSWKPSYGVYFDVTSDPKSFVYFTDLGVWDGNNNNTQNSLFDGSFVDCTGECLDKIAITKGNKISRIDKCTGDTCPPIDSDSISSLAVLFKRPDSSAIFTGADVSGSEYIKITIESPKGATAFIKIYPSGRIQVN